MHIRKSVQKLVFPLEEANVGFSKGSGGGQRAKKRSHHIVILVPLPLMKNNKRYLSKQLSLGGKNGMSDTDKDMNLKGA
ncbi:hypothetical protein GQ457_06G018950 [Hibiscus cannabinus]